jgi:glycosyltransferase involved in cell wall biosynthesis
LPAELDQLKAYKAIHVHYAGFVDDISLYFKGADLFINPVEDGGGIKTKLVEALGNNLPAVSTVNGAIGIPLTVTGSSLLVVPNKDPESFIAAILKQSFLKSDIPDSFFEYFYWDHIGKKAAVTLKEIGVS